MPAIRELELLAPARDYDTAVAAILHGADAVYIGAPSHGARAKAVNSIDDIRRLVAFAAPYGVKVYVTVNTIVYDSELAEVESMVWDLYRAGIDALIVQDMALLEMRLPPIALHASTQCDTRDAAKARFLQDVGFSQIVVARELSLSELADICSHVDVPVEAFVHGALCVSYSGDCQASLLATGRSANRGECAQMCRLPYDLIDGNGNVIGRQRHYLSLRDLNRVEHLAAMAEAGVRSFKIEGRLKDQTYVKNVTAAYRQALDRLIEAHPDRYRRPSRGISHLAFTPSLSKSFNRGFTDYFLKSEVIDHRRLGVAKIASIESPKSLGEPVGRVKAVKGVSVIIDSDVNLANGDGLTYIAADGSAGGFRVNRADGNRLTLLEPVNVPIGARLYRSYDKAWETAMLRETARRLIPLEMCLRVVESGRQTGDGAGRVSHDGKTDGNVAGRVCLEGRIDGLGCVGVVCDCELQPSNKPAGSYRQETLGKLGGTIFTLAKLDDRAGDLFIRASVLSELRRRLVEALTATLLAKRRLDRRRPASAEASLPSPHITRHDNVANHLAERFYRSHGALTIEPSTETLLAAPKALDPCPTADGAVARVAKGRDSRYDCSADAGAVATGAKASGQKSNSEIMVMTMRYCLRRELGACLRDGGASRLPGPLYLRGRGVTYRLDFDCAACQMALLAPTSALHRP